jgi:hypothetical protein
MTNIRKSFQSYIMGHLTGENLKVVWAEISVVSLVTKLLPEPTNRPRFCFYYVKIKKLYPSIINIGRKSLKWFIMKH